MCVTTAVEGRLALRGDRTKDLGSLLTYGVSFLHERRLLVVLMKKRGVLL